MRYLPAATAAFIITSAAMGQTARVGPADDLQAACDRSREVVLTAGGHYLSRPLLLEPRHSGLKLRGEPGAVLSGGVPLENWRQESESVWITSAPADAQILRVGDDWATMARRPDLDRANPITGGWLYVPQPDRRRGKFDSAVCNLHTAGDWLQWEITVPHTATYAVHFRYGADNAAWGVSTMGSRCTLQLDDSPPSRLTGLPNTGAWAASTWGRVIELPLTQGTHRLKWTNVEGGGLNLDAVLLTDDLTSKPAGHLAEPPKAVEHRIVVQAESAIAYQGKELLMPEESAEFGEKLSFRTKPKDLPHYRDLWNLQIHLFPAWGWVNSIVRPKSIDLTKNTVELITGVATSEEIWPGNRYFIANAREDMDQPGEWCIDRRNGELRLRSGVSPSNAVAAKLTRLIELRGSKDRPVRDISIDGITFRDTTYSLDVGVYAPSDAAITGAGTADCQISNCRFIGVGGYALRLGQWNDGFRFLRSEVAGAGQGGVLLEGKLGDQPINTEIAANSMRDLGRIYKHVAGIYGLCASRTHVAHNRIERVPRYAISFKSFGGDAVSQENMIEYNELLQTNLETNDSGAIETLGRHERDMHNVIRYNLIRETGGLKTMSDGTMKRPYFTWGVYLDDYSSGTSVFGNIIIGSQSGAVFIHGGSNNVIENNIFIEGAESQLRLQPRQPVGQNNRILRNVVYYTGDSANLIHTSSPLPKGMLSACDSNLFWHAKGEAFFDRPQLTPLGSLAQWRAGGYDQQSVIADPRFVPASASFELQESSPAHALGFHRIPIERIGIGGYRDNFPK